MDLSISKKLVNKRWLDSYDKYIIRQNGYIDVPYLRYYDFLVEIDQSGDIIELGCGNGLLLRYLAVHSNYKLNTYGIDCNSTLILEAQNNIHVESPNQFMVNDIRKLNKLDRKYNVMISNPLYVNSGYYEQEENKINYLRKDNSISDYCNYCLNQLHDNGKLIFFLYRGQLKEIADDFTFLNDSLKNHNLIYKGFSESKMLYFFIYNLRRNIPASD